MRYFIAIVSLFCAIQVQAQQGFAPPSTKSIPVIDTLHGVLLTDDYRWLEDKNDPKVIEWTKAQHDYGIDFLKRTQKSHAGLYNDIATYLGMDFEGPLDREGKRVFQTVKKKGEKQNKLYTLLNGKKI